MFKSVHWPSISVALAFLTIPVLAGPQEDFDRAVVLSKEKNFVEAHALFKAAAKQGYVDAQVELGRIYASGMGVPQSFFNAHIWYDIAVANGSTSAVFVRRHASYELSEAEITEAKRLAKLCIESGYQECD
jgi:uncharacterized protein